MITVFLKEDGHVERNISPSKLASLNPENVLWIDLLMPSATEQKSVENFISMHLLSKEKAEEIESTSKYYETSGAIVSNSNYFISKGENYEIEPVSFIVTKDGVLVSLRHHDLVPFADTEKRLAQNREDNTTGYHLLITSLEALIDYDADMVELVTREISKLSKDIAHSPHINKNVIYRINELQEKTMSLREDIFDLQRVISGINRSNRFPHEIKTRLEFMNKDIESLIQHGDISFSRLDYMQDTAMGLINIEQNEIVKILSVAAVIFMPPTLIASIYGMNFKVMPELDWVWTTSHGWVIPAGYIFALALMLLVTFLTYWYFRYKKWL